MSIYKKLYTYQKNIVDKFKDRDSFGLFLDMGIGKTTVSLAFAEIHNCSKILIISINAKAIEDEFTKGSFFWWLKQSDINYNLYTKKHSFDGTGPKKYRAILTQDTKDVLLVNYESLFKRIKPEDRTKKDPAIILKENITQFIESCKNQNVCVILDESHNIKTNQSTQTKACQKIRKLLNMYSSNVYTYLLTGTPFTSGFEDLYTQLNFLGLPMTKTSFFDNFCVKGHVPNLEDWQQPVVGYKHVKDLFRIVHNYSITIKSEEVLDLPEQIFVEHVIDQSNSFKLLTSDKLKADEINKEFERRNLEERVESGSKNGKVNNPFYKNIAYPSFLWTADTSASMWLRCRQMSIGFQGNEENDEWYDRRRLEELRKLLENHPDNYVLFYNYTSEFIELYLLCDELGYKIDMYNGKYKILDYYNEYSNMSEEERLSDSKRIILANFASGSTGVNWQEYNKCILFSLPLFGDYQQGIKRVHRAGQKSTVIYHIFRQNNFLDDAMLQALKDKKQYDDSMFKNDLSKIQNLIKSAEAIDNCDNNEEKHFSDFVRMLVTHPECKAITTNKQVDISVFLIVQSVEEYNNLTGYDSLTEKEFNLLKNAM